MNSTDILKKIDLLDSKDPIDALQETCQILTEISHYNWVGFYFMEDSTKELILGPYVGKKTNHTKIPYGKGVCGQVAISGETFVVQDVDQEENYLACSLDTKSEIVVPIYKGGKLIGQIDIDSHIHHPFKVEDEILLKKVCEITVRKGWV